MDNNIQNTIISIVASPGKTACTVNFSMSEPINCSMDIIMKYQLVKGKVVNDDVISEIIKSQRIVDSKRQSYSYTTKGLKTARQIKDYLLKKGFGSDEIEESIKFLKSYNLIDDKKFAAEFVRFYTKKKKAAASRVIIELMNRGISKHIAEEAVTEHYQFSGEPELARSAAEKKLRLVQGKPVEKQISAIKSHLQRKGFNWRLINETVKSLFKEDINY